MIGDIVTVTVDRPLGSFHPKHKDIYYPVNYGYIEGVTAPDGEEQDAYILGVNEVVLKFTGKVIAIIHRFDDVEEKWVVCPENCFFSKEEIMEQVKFQEQYFRSEIIMQDPACQDYKREQKGLKMKALVINCSPVRNGATAEIVNIVSDHLRERYEVKSICIDDFDIRFCKGCRTCHSTAECIRHDDAEVVMQLFEWADMIVSVVPSYWADVPGQFKVFIDRCTPWCNTHEPHASISGGKKGYTIALRTGPGMRECDRIIESIEHFYGHLEIERCDRLGLCSIEYKEAVEARKSEIIEFCNKI